MEHGAHELVYMSGKGDREENRYGSNVNYLSRCRIQGNKKSMQPEESVKVNSERKVGGRR